ncbi:hypothetical protein [Blastococcus brunescens]|uniref:Uncharacterized protein n=1 Tax=Blastococcus brunescens TaxID=1564165 RepID=A0ABZ1AUS7_9ACTN|nr:hypothetical protein [Blastococcus sp. BMG 8361]WRL62255.1 hypothetical protein U6N30_19725 [Blastococcus sp. BMG 8361]
MSGSGTSDVATPRTMAASLAIFYAFGGATGLLVVLGADPAGYGREALAGLMVTAFAVGAVVARWGARWPRAVFHGLVAAGTALISTAAMLSPDTATAMVCGALMSFIAVDAFFFFRRRAAVLHMVAAVVAITTALQVRGDVPCSPPWPSTPSSSPWASRRGAWCCSPPGPPVTR